MSSENIGHRRSSTADSQVSETSIRETPLANPFVASASNFIAFNRSRNPEVRKRRRANAGIAAPRISEVRASGELPASPTRAQQVAALVASPSYQQLRDQFRSMQEFDPLSPSASISAALPRGRMPLANVPTVIAEEGEDNDDPDPADEPGEPGGPPSNPPNSPGGGGGGSPGGGPPGGGGGPPGGGPPGGGFPPFGNPPEDPNNNEQLAFSLLRQMNDFLKNLNVTMQK